MTIDTAASGDVEIPSQSEVAVPSPVLWISGLPDDDDDGELEMRLARFGELQKLDRQGPKAIATFRHIKAASDAMERMNGYLFSSGRSIQIQYAPQTANPLAEIDAITGQVLRSNRDMHYKIGQLVRSTYSAMRGIAGNYPPPKQSLLPEDFKYIQSLNEFLELESKWAPTMSVSEMMSDYEQFADRRPFHNRYLLVEVTTLNSSESIVGELTKLVHASIPPSSLLHMKELQDEDNGKQRFYVHIALKSTRDASIVYAALNPLCGASGGVFLTARYAPPISVTSNRGALWVGCSAFMAIDEHAFHRMLSLFGTLLLYKLVPNKNCAFVTFAEESAAVSCRNKLFSYEIAPGHFLNTDFAPEEDSSSFNRRRPLEAMSDVAYPPPPHHTFSAPKRRASVEESTVELLKLGERMCSVLARRFPLQFSEDTFGNVNTESPSLAESIDITNRTKIDYCKAHLDKMGWTTLANVANGISRPTSSINGFVTMYHFAAASERDCQGYDLLCDYFVNKDRIGFHSVSTENGSSIATYFIPPVPEFLEPLGLPLDTRYLIGLQMPSAAVAK